MNCTDVLKEQQRLQGEVAALKNQVDNCLRKGLDCSEIIKLWHEAEDRLLPVEEEAVTCDLLTGTWAFNGNGFTGTLTIEASNAQNNGSATFSGHAVIDVPHRDIISGSYDASAGVLRFTRTGDDNNERFQPQHHYGHIFANPGGNAKPTFGGVFAEGAPPSLESSSPWGWFMVKQ